MISKSLKIIMESSLKQHKVNKQHIFQPSIQVIYSYDPFKHWSENGFLSYLKDQKKLTDFDCPQCCLFIYHEKIEDVMLYLVSNRLDRQSSLRVKHLDNDHFCHLKICTDIKITSLCKWSCGKLQRRLHLLICFSVLFTYCF